MKTNFARHNIGAVLAFLALTAVTSQAALTHFQLSPAGTDVAIGLSPSNQVPPAATSTGSGNTIAGGIVFDSATSILQMAIGYGSAAGFTDLTGAASAMHIHGPAPVGQNAGVLVSLVPYNFPAANPAHGGVIVGSILFPTNLTASLLGGSNYVNIHTAAYPGGEIRGQLIPVNQAPSITCPAPATAECGTPVTVSVSVSDDEGDALVVVWSVNGVPVQTNQVPAGGPPTTATVTITNQFPLGMNVIAVNVSDGANSASCSTTVTVSDTTPPAITNLTATPALLWPPFNQMVDVQIQAAVTDGCGTPSWKITSVTSNEPSAPGGAPDWLITGDHTLQLRAQRAGMGTGRVYTITVAASDGTGNVTTKTVLVTVPHDLSPK